MNDWEMVNRFGEGRDKLQCPRCSRKGAVRTKLRHRTKVGHTCPGPWVLEAVEESPENFWGTWRATYYSLTEEDINRAGWKLGHAS